MYVMEITVRQIIEGKRVIITDNVAEMQEWAKTTEKMRPEELSAYVKMKTDGAVEVETKSASEEAINGSVSRERGLDALVVMNGKVQGGWLPSNGNGAGAGVGGAVGLGAVGLPGATSPGSTTSPNSPASATSPSSPTGATSPTSPTSVTSETEDEGTVSGVKAIAQEDEKTIKVLYYKFFPKREDSPPLRGRGLHTAQSRDYANMVCAKALQGVASWLKFVDHTQQSGSRRWVDYTLPQANGTQATTRIMFAVGSPRDNATRRRPGTQRPGTEMFSFQFNSKLAKEDNIDWVIVGNLGDGEAYLFPVDWCLAQRRPTHIRMEPPMTQKFLFDRKIGQLGNNPNP